MGTPLPKTLLHPCFGQGGAVFTCGCEERGQSSRRGQGRGQRILRVSYLPQLTACLRKSSSFVILVGFFYFDCSVFQVICDMENQIHKLREELIQVNAQRKQQLLELSHQWEEKKQRVARDHETALNKLKVEAEKMTLDLKKIHAAEIEKALEKVRGSHGASPCGTAQSPQK